jgi:hypothetical protein
VDLGDRAGGHGDVVCEDRGLGGVGAAGRDDSELPVITITSSLSEKP